LAPDAGHLQTLSDPTEENAATPSFHSNPLYMRLMCFVFVLLFSGAAANGQTTATRTPVKILDFGGLYSTFDWKAEPTAELKTSLGDALAETVMRASNESAWPTGIASLGERAKNRAEMPAYTAYYLTTVSKSIAVLVVPAAENRDMPADMQPASDIYFLILDNGIEFDNETISEEDSEDLSTQGFEAQMNALTLDFSNGFSNVVNMQIDESEDGMVVMYGTLVPLDGTTALYFIEDLFAATTNFHAEFPGSTDPAVALKKYRELVQKVESLKLSCCGLSKLDEEVVGKRRSQVFNAHDSKGKMAPAYLNMSIQVSIEQGEEFDKAGQLVTNWFPVLDIYGRE
jgi:hypothetical protein